MALTWDWTGIANWKSVVHMEAPCDMPNSGIKKGEMILTPLAQAMPVICLAVGIGVITEDNAEEFYCRLELHQRVNGAILYWGEDQAFAPRKITFDDVKDFIGLRTNVSKMKDIDFYKTLIRDVRPRR